MILIRNDPHFKGNDTFWKIASFVLENFRSDGVLVVSTPDNNIGYLSGYVDLFIRNKVIQRGKKIRMLLHSVTHTFSRYNLSYSTGINGFCS